MIKYFSGADAGVWSSESYRVCFHSVALGLASPSYKMLTLKEKYEKGLCFGLTAAKSHAPALLEQCHFLGCSGTSL